MKQTLLISVDDMRAFAQMAVNSRDEVMVQPHILSAQNKDVAPVLGNALYTDLIENRNDAKYTKLLNGGTYVVGGVTLSFQGLRAAIACFAFAHYKMFSNAVDTPFGTVTKTSESSEPADAKIILAIASGKRSEGSLYLTECLRFLKENPDTYPLFETGCDITSGAKSIHRLTPASKI